MRSLYTALFFKIINWPYITTRKNEDFKNKTQKKNKMYIKYTLFFTNIPAIITPRNNKDKIRRKRRIKHTFNIPKEGTEIYWINSYLNDKILKTY